MLIWMELSSTQSSLKALLYIFIIWKALVLSIALVSPGIGYDTSTSLLLHGGDSFNELQNVPTGINHNALKLVRWDAIYFTGIARDGHVFEQEWAFGVGFPTILRYMTKAFGLENHHDLVGQTVAGILISHVSHGCSVILLFLTANLLQEPTESTSSTVAFTAAILHVISPAGVFLSAPYTESLFSFLNMLGCYLYVSGTLASNTHSRGLALTCKLSAGISFGLATSVRSNGILSGIPFLIDAVETGLQLLSSRVDTYIKPSLFLQLQFTVLAGCSIGAGFVYPQFLAYREYCIQGPGDRPWCTTRLPSIFTFAQSHYWNVGFMKYWTLSNIPLFILALPCLCILIFSGTQAVYPALSMNPTSLQKLHMRIALPQFTLALLALTSYHVQIINRLSSGYPTWYIWLAMNVGKARSLDVTIRILAMYGLIQAGLFASFLPPA